MKLVVQIPCLNEEKTLPMVVRSIPKHIKGIDKVETLVIDDGSTDNTYETAKRLGVDHVLRHRVSRGLAFTFADGIDYAIKLGADIIVNTDADNQYPQKDIPRLIEPILSRKADIVVADRQTAKIAHFSLSKKMFQWFGSAVVRRLSNTQVPDAVSGFRAYSRSAAMRLNVVTDFSYVIETIIQAQSKRMAIGSIPVETNPPTRPSRLFKGIVSHMRHSASAILRVYTMYNPLIIFFAIGGFISLVGFVWAFRFLYFFLQGKGSGHVQSLIFAAILIMVGFQIAMTGVVADLIAINRKLLENALTRIKLIQLKEEEKVNGKK